MNVIIFPSITVITERISLMEEERRRHKAEQTKVLEVIKSQILRKDLIGILEVKRYCKKTRETTEWVTFIISPDADNPGHVYQKISELLSNHGGCGESLMAGMYIKEFGGELSELKKILEKLN